MWTSSQQIENCKSTDVQVDTVDLMILLRNEHVFFQVNTFIEWNITGDIQGEATWLPFLKRNKTDGTVQMKKLAKFFYSVDTF